MKKHHFLHTEIHSTVKFSTRDQKIMNQWLVWASATVEEMINAKVLPWVKPKSLQVSLLICGDSRMKQLNFEHRKKNKVTDVLSFPAYEDLRNSKQLTQMSELFLGDLAICHPQTKRQAKEFKIGYWDEFIHLYFHGLLHLMGYDHELSKVEEKLMQKWEEKFLEKFSAKKKGA